LNAVKFGFATFCSNAGDVIYSVALAWYIANELESGVWMGAVLFSLGVSRFIAGLLCGPAIDRIGAKVCMWWSDVMRAIVVLSLAALIWQDAISFAALMAVCILFGVIDAFYWPAAESIKPRLVPLDELSRINSQYFTVIRTTAILGPLAAAAMIGALWMNRPQERAKEAAMQIMIGVNNYRNIF
jgi:DHA3 family macrolide efflux protein-like MFS transporter